MNWKNRSTSKKETRIYRYLVSFLKESECSFVCSSRLDRGHQQTTFCSCLVFPPSEVDRRPCILTATFENSARRSDSEARLHPSDRTQCGPASRQTTNFRPKVDLLTMKTRANEASTFYLRNKITVLLLCAYLHLFLSYSRMNNTYINSVHINNWN